MHIVSLIPGLSEDKISGMYIFRKEDINMFRTQDEEEYNKISYSILSYKVPGDGYIVECKLPKGGYRYRVEEIEEPTPIFVGLTIMEQDLDCCPEKIRSHLEDAWDYFKMYSQTVDEYNFTYGIF